MEECSCSEHIEQKVRWEENDPMENMQNMQNLENLQNMQTELYSIHETQASQSHSRSNSHSVTTSKSGNMDNLVILDSDIEADPECDEIADLQSTTNININASHSLTIQTPTPTQQMPPQQLQQIQEKGTFSEGSEFNLQSPTMPETPPSEPTRSGSNSSIEHYLTSTLEVQRASTEGQTCVITDGAQYRLQRSKSPSDNELDSAKSKPDDNDLSSHRCQCVVL